MAITITASHPKFNGYFNSESYYNYSRILALVNIGTGKVDRLVGRRSPVYLSQKNIPNFDHLNYEITEKNILVNFWVDSSIYIIDKKTDKATGKFGEPGKNINAGYPRTQSYEAAEKNWQQDLEHYGYYHYMTRIPHKNTLYRGYKKGGTESTDGLQIYNGYTLIGDIAVPKGLEIIGEIDDVVYAINPLDENDDALRLYTIQF